MSMAARAVAVGAAVEDDVLLRAQDVAAVVDWTACLPQRANSFSWQAQQQVKRLLDIILATAGLIVLLPFLVLIGLLIKLTSPGPVLYEWRVLGVRGRPFVGYKFRTMIVDADALKASYLDRNEMTGPVFKMRGDPRITPLGRWLRKYSIDELPQLWSVLKGDMSLVGPRPPSAAEFVRYEPWQRGKLAVTPGITCLWQVGGRSEITDFGQWAALDLEYIRRWNLLLDAIVLLRTIPAVISARGAY